MTFAALIVSLTSLHVHPHVVAPGGSVVVTGNAGDCPRGDVVGISSHAFPGHGFAGIGEIHAHAGADGAFKASGRVRVDARPGTYLVTARCGGGDLGVSALLRVR